MAVMTIVEFSRQGADFEGRPIWAPDVSAITAQQNDIAIGAGSLASAAFNAKTRLIRVNVDANCRVAFGDAPVAVATNFARMTAGATEYFCVAPGQKIAVIASAS